MNSRKNELCREKLHAHNAVYVAEAIHVPVCQKLNELSEQNNISRRCMTKEEWTTLASTPNRECLPRFKSMEDKPSKAIPKRISELSQPPRQRMVSTLRDRGQILPTPLVDRLINNLKTESSLSSEPVDKLFQTKRTRKKRKKKSKRQQKQSRTSDEATPVRRFDEDAIACQYSMAEAFLKSVLESECNIPGDEFQDISRVIFNRLRQLFHVTSVDNDARRTQQMHLLADVVAGWVAGILFEIAELEESELNNKSDTAHNGLEENADIDDDEAVIDMENFSDTSKDSDDSDYSDNNRGEHGHDNDVNID